MLESKKQKIKELKKRADELRQAVLEFDKVLTESKGEIEDLKKEVTVVVDKKKMHNVLDKILKIKEY